MGEDQQNPEDQIRVLILDEAGSIVRTLYQKPRAGVNRLAWGLDRNRPRYPNQPKPEKPAPPRGGVEVIPGAYTVRVSYQDWSSEAKVQVHKDPLIGISQEEMADKAELFQRHYENVAKVTTMMDKLRSTEASLDFVEGKLKDQGDYEQLQEQFKSVRDQLKSFKERVLSKEAQGIYRDPEALLSQLRQTEYLLDNPLVAPSENQVLQLMQTERACRQAIAAFNDFVESDLAALRKAVEARQVKMLD